MRVFVSKFCDANLNAREEAETKQNKELGYMLLSRGPKLLSKEAFNRIKKIKGIEAAKTLRDSYQKEVDLFKKNPEEWRRFKKLQLKNPKRKFEISFDKKRK